MAVCGCACSQVLQEQLYYTNKAEFKKWVGIWVRGQCLQRELANPHAFSEIAPCFETRFPFGLSVKAVNLAAKPELNGRVGTVTKYDESKLRVGVEFAAPFGLLSLKHTNIEMADPAARAEKLLKKYERKQK